MAINTYSTLKTSVQDFMARNDLSGSVADWITLAEARLNRILPLVDADATLTGTAGSNVISIASLNASVPRYLWVVVDGEEEAVTKKTDGQFAYGDTSGQPSFWAVDGAAINFERPLDQAYSFRLRYQGRLALSDAAPTNDLLTNHPDVYLAASIVWGGIYIKDAEHATQFKSILDEFVTETRREIAKSRAGTLSVDPALTSQCRYSWGFGS